ncbi:tubulin polyglutamylase complex subunit 2 isoform X2 [Turdus rufiventris]|nr:tubulin polyglutamylase complex subunit 2 isoform X2 [Turdus rufiventris]
MEEKLPTGIKPYLDKLTLGVTRILETSPGVAEVTFVEKEPAERHTIVSWEQKNSCVLPEDLKNFYLMTDGFQMTWSVKTDGLTIVQRPQLLVQLSCLSKHPAVPSDTHHTGMWLNRVLAALMSGNSLSPQKHGQVKSPVGFFQKHPHVDALVKSSVEVGPKTMYPEQVHGVEEDKLPSKLVSKLCRLGGSSMYTLPSAPTLADLEDDTDEEGNGDKPEKPHFDSRSLIFELDPCNGNGKVCLVYKHAEPVVSPDTEIWFLDRALYWHFLTKTFTAYYRLLITHLGLPQWQYAFTSYGVSPQAKQWFNMYKPITINTALLSEETDSFVNKLDPNKVFKSKNKTPVLKKKPPSQPPGSQKSHTSTTSAKTSSLAGNSSRK